MPSGEHAGLRLVLLGLGSSSFVVWIVLLLFLLVLLVIIFLRCNAVTQKSSCASKTAKLKASTSSPSSSFMRFSSWSGSGSCDAGIIETHVATSRHTSPSGSEEPLAFSCRASPAPESGELRHASFGFLGAGANLIRVESPYEGSVPASQDLDGSGSGSGSSPGRSLPRAGRKRRQAHALSRPLSLLNLAN